ncbi:OsmC family protein [Azospirillum doebereinerae]|uniref:OsmC family peroxiredoxin n=1 Tax=Azospirillum doebereinerae TaxID=92933 RepID=A0A433J5K5_9PROT|nr:OsmC family protein [Azospirillum doebereinerae]MCG5239359.1 OsmC family protein [Azospirillum doebereinerae]RUQ67855.1 OsmC family peroxiredoxin [Azospirillum doebereinerae]
MANRQHRYGVRLDWTGNLGNGTSSYRGYSRDHSLSAPGKPAILGTSDPAFRGDPARWNPEETLVGALSACHQLWYLALCSTNGIVVTAYEDDAEGVMEEEAGGAGQFTGVVLRPRVTLAPGSDRDKALALHHDASAKCFIARSVNFPVTHEPVVTVEAG